MGEQGAGTSDAGPAAGIRDALERLGFTDALTLAEVAVLHRDHPRWAVWMPADGGEWTAVQPTGSRPPGPEGPMVWVRAGSAAELSERMSRADGALLHLGQG